jgi:hypothetical protein
MPYKDPEKRAEYMRKYQQENREKINEINKDSRKRTNRRERDKERYLNDPEYREKVLAKNRAQAKKHRDRNRQNLNKRRKEQKQRMIDHLGGKCVGCGCAEDLQFDHIDRKQKQSNVSRLFGYSDERVLIEVNKCQLLCEQCHQYKTTINHDTNKLAEGYKVSKVEKFGDKIMVTLEPLAPIAGETQ